MVKIIFVFSQTHRDFRIAEFKAICDLFSINIDLSPLNTEDHIIVLDFESVDDVRLILSRCVLVKFAIEYFEEGPSYNEICKKIEDIGHIRRFDNPEESFAVRLFSIGRKKKVDTIQRIKKFLDFLTINNAPVDLKTPKNKFYILEKYANPTDMEPCQVFFGKMIGDGQTLLKTKYNLKDRCYIGNTTMDPELAFLQANIAQVKPSDLVLDPFVGTGGLILSAAEFGALVMGMEINYQTAKAIGRSSRQGVGERGSDESILANFEQQGTDNRLLAILIGDSSKHGIWRENPQFDVIIADPPYGVREKGRKLGENIEGTRQKEEIPSAMIQYPKKEDYNLENVFCDLLDLAAHSCVIGGRVSFWYPVILEFYNDDSPPKHPAMKLISNCEQPLTRHTSRRLLTYSKVREPCDEENSEILKAGVSSYRSTLFKSKKR